jgi:uncharacterized membrane protein YdjX (TVP38/TMEM64 family)
MTGETIADTLPGPTADPPPSRAGGDNRSPGDMTATDPPSRADAPGKSRAMRLLPLAAIGIAVALVFALDLDRYLSFETLKSHRQTALAWYADNPALVVLGFMAIYALVVALSLPGAVWMTLIAGFLFGTVAGTFFVVTAATVGALGIFLIARYALADFFHEKTGEAGRRMEEGFRKDALSYLLFLRLVPLFPFWLVNLVPALLGVPARSFVIGTFLGIIPGTVVFCSVGNGLGAIFDAGGRPDLGVIFEPEVLGPLLALAALSLVPVVYKRIRARKGEA